MIAPHPFSSMTRFRIFWDAADAALARRGLPLLDYEQARQWFDLEYEPADIAEAIALALVAKEASR